MSNNFYDFLINDDSMHDRFMRGLSELNEEYVQFVSEKGKNSCSKCLKYHGQVYKKSDVNKPKIPLHKNCNCAYIPCSEPQRELYFRVKGSPGKYGYLGGGLTFNGINDFIKIIKNLQIPPHSINLLVILNHSGLEGSFFMGNNDKIQDLTNSQLDELKEILHKDSVVDIRMCKAGGDTSGAEIAQDLANALGCSVIVYEGTVSPWGTQGIDLGENTFFADHKPVEYYPQEK